MCVSGGDGFSAIRLYRIVRLQRPARLYHSLPTCTELSAYVPARLAAGLSASVKCRLIRLGQPVCLYWPNRLKLP